MSDGNRRKKGPRAKGTTDQEKTPPKAADVTTPGEATGDATEESPPTSKAPTSKKIKLPAFGMAEDLLRELRKQEAGEDSELDADAPAPAEEALGEEAVAAAASSLDRGDPERIFDFADRLQGSRDAGKDQEKQQLEAFVTFHLAGETFGLPVQPIREVMRIAAITRVPHAPRPIRGVTNLRGRVIPVIDLRQRIGLPSAEVETSHRIIVVTVRQRLIGLLVDGVRQVVHLDLLKVQPPPDDVMTVQSDYISGIYQLDRELVLLLDVERSLVIKEPGVA